MLAHRISDANMLQKSMNRSTLRRRNLPPSDVEYEGWRVVNTCKNEVGTFGFSISLEGGYGEHYETQTLVIIGAGKNGVNESRKELMNS
jgi:hypothetical protein